MIADTILTDHEAGREIFATAGNAPQPSHDERFQEFRRFHVLWATHDAMMENIVFPALIEADQGALIEETRRNQRRIMELVAELETRAQRDDPYFLDAFERLHALFETQCRLEDAEVAALIRATIPPERLARMTREARALRAERLAGTGLPV